MKLTDEQRLAIKLEVAHLLRDDFGPEAQIDEWFAAIAPLVLERAALQVQRAVDSWRRDLLGQETADTFEQCVDILRSLKEEP